MIGGRNMKLDDNYKKIKVFIANKGRECSNRERILEEYYKNAQKNNYDNFNKDAIKMFADWGYKFEDFDFGNNSELKSYAKSRRISYYVTWIILVIIACVVGFFFLGGGKLISKINENKNKPSENEINCSSKLIKYAWTEKDGCQKSTFDTRKDCLFATYYKTYYYDHDTYSYKKYHEYYYDEDLEKTYRVDTSNSVADGKSEFYITCSNDGNWHTNEVKNGNINPAVKYWNDKDNYPL